MRTGPLFQGVVTLPNLKCICDINSTSQLNYLTTNTLDKLVLNKFSLLKFFLTTYLGRSVHLVVVPRVEPVPMALASAASVSEISGQKYLGNIGT